jgi:hypothetical protein
MSRANALPQLRREFFCRQQYCGAGRANDFDFNRLLATVRYKHFTYGWQCNVHDLNDLKHKVDYVWASYPVHQSSR